ncbi:unnamed protein product [Allacma fusca]|uniref:Glucose-methanol-choline oxidoreductase N-terminal domain-containing protein n=1 Tax=Allacma fusca TaxID=39272 RepID=A0A8J2NRP9_9HEXA|nr:unnamed protein product [Allacma fusca]
MLIVGGGSGGAVVATRLSEVEGFNVLLLEAGGDETLTTQIPWFHTLLPGSDLDWKFQTVPQDGFLLAYDDQVSRWPRGRVIGGTSSINTMIYMRGNRNDYDQWAELGNKGWSYQDVLPYFIKAERQTDPVLAADSLHHGTNGPLVVTTQRHRTPLMHAFLKAGRYMGYEIGDPNGYTQSVFSPFQMTINHGKRWSTARAYLRPTHSRKNFHVSLNSHVHRILFDENKRAVGVKYFHRGVMHMVRCRKEVILSAGTVVSPQILMLSGIGPAAHLQDMKIPVLADLPVGENLQDHVGVFGLSWTAKKGSGYSLLSLANPVTFKQYYTSQTGYLAETVGVEGNAFLHSRYANKSLDWPDIQIFFVSATPALDGGQTFTSYLGISKETWDSYFQPLAFREGFTIVPVLLRPFSKGYIRLRSANPMHKPIINPNYLKDHRDFDILIDGLKKAIEIGNSPPFKRFQAKLHVGVLPRCPRVQPFSDEYWDCFVRHFAQTEHHVAGTCKMGPPGDPTAVVDPELRVYGVSGLRVVDGSIMPNVVSGNTNAPIIMIAERASDLIKNSWRVDDDTETSFFDF